MNDTEASSGFSTVVFWAISVVLLLGALLAALYFKSFDTQYAPGYSAKAFKSIKLGDTEQRVVSLLGAPLSTYDSEPYLEWIYSADEQKRFSASGVGTGTFTTVRFNPDGRVASISGQRQTSAGTMTFGEGQNSLNLTGEQIRALKGSTQDEILQKFGSPKAVYEYKASKVLSYSRSPSSANYHLRSVGLDADGKVVHVWREIYWD